MEKQSRSFEYVQKGVKGLLSACQWQPGKSVPKKLAKDFVNPKNDNENDFVSWENCVQNSNLFPHLIFCFPNAVGRAALFRPTAMSNII